MQEQLPSFLCDRRGWREHCKVQEQYSVNAGLNIKEKNHVE